MAPVDAIAHLLEEDTMQPASAIDFKVAAIAQRLSERAHRMKSRPTPKPFSSPGLTGVNMTDIIPGTTFGAWTVSERPRDAPLGCFVGATTPVRVALAGIGKAGESPKPRLRQHAQHASAPAPLLLRQRDPAGAQARGGRKRHFGGGVS